MVWAAWVRASLALRDARLPCLQMTSSLGFRSRTRYEGNAGVRVSPCRSRLLPVLLQKVKLFSEFYDSDIIVASPLSLRLVTGTGTCGRSHHPRRFHCHGCCCAVARREW